MEKSTSEGLEGLEGLEGTAASVSVCIPLLDESLLGGRLPACPDWPDLN